MNTKAKIGCGFLAASGFFAGFLGINVSTSVEIFLTGMVTAIMFERYFLNK